MPDIGVVVLVDDSVDDARFIRRAIERHPSGVRLEVFSRGEQALAYIHEHAGEVRLVLLDIVLPTLSGPHFIRQLRRHNDRGCLPVVVFTAVGGLDWIEEAFAAGANSYVFKPVRFETFQEAVQQVLHYWLDMSLRDLGEGAFRSA